MRSDSRFNAEDVLLLTPGDMRLMCLGGKRVKLLTYPPGFTHYYNTALKCIEGRLAWEYLEGNQFVGLIGMN